MAQDFDQWWVFILVVLNDQWWVFILVVLNIRVLVPEV
jgi:hypothetical protein